MFSIVLFCVLVFLVASQNTTLYIDDNNPNWDDDRDFYVTTQEEILIGPQQCKLMAYDVKRALYRYQIAASYEGGNCSTSIDFYASELLTPEVYIKNPFRVVSLPFEVCMLYAEQQEIPQELQDRLQRSWLQGDQISFMEVHLGTADQTNFTCYDGWRYQILANNCQEEEVQVYVRIDSGGDSDSITSEGCVEKAYTGLVDTLGIVVFVSILFNCTCCCCLFCDCCLPCARFFGRINNDQEHKIVELTSMSKKGILNNSTSSQRNQQQDVKNSQEKQSEAIKNRVSIHSTEGQNRWLTFSIAIANVVYLWIQLYPPNYEHDPNRVDYGDTSVCGLYVDENAEGYVQKVCRFGTIFIHSYFMGLSTFIVVLSNYTTRQDPWFRFRMVLSAAVLLLLNIIFLLDNAQFFYRSQYMKQPVSYYFAGVVIWSHLIAADVIFVVVIVLGYGQNNNTRILERAPLVKKTLRREQQQKDAEVEASSDHQNQLQQFLRKFGKWLMSFWHVLREEQGFKYSIFMLISVTAAIYIIIMIFINLMYRRDSFLDCLKDFNGCISREMETYVVFIRQNAVMDSVYTLLQDVNVTQLSIESVNDTIASIQSSIGSISDSPTWGLANVSAAINSVSAICLQNFSSETPGASLLASFPEIKQLCTALNTTQLEPVLQLLEGDLNKQVDQISGILDKTGGLLERTQAVIIRSTDSDSEWSDSIDTPFKVASAIGLVVGLLMGLSVLYITLVSYKRITIHLTLEKVISALSRDEQEQSATLKHTLENFGVVASIYFFGIVLSTSAIQMYIFSIFLTFSFTVVFSPWLWTVFLKKYYPYIAVYAGILIINALVVQKLGQRMISQKDQSIKRPALWLAYYIICSFAYLLLGTLFAVYRIVYLLLTTLVAINRLDISLFTILPGLDNGHKAFMGMVLMAQAMADIGRGRDRKKKKAEARWKKLREAVKDEEGQFIKKVTDSPIIQSSLFSLVDDSDDDAEDDTVTQGVPVAAFLDQNALGNSNMDGDQVAAIKRFLYRSRTTLNNMDPNTIPQTQVVTDRAATFGGPSHIKTEQI